MGAGKGTYETQRPIAPQYCGQGFALSSGRRKENDVRVLMSCRKTKGQYISTSRTTDCHIGDIVSVSIHGALVSRAESERIGCLRAYLI